MEGEQSRHRQHVQAKTGGVACSLRVASPERVVGRSGRVEGRRYNGGGGKWGGGLGEGRIALVDMWITFASGADVRTSEDRSCGNFRAAPTGVPRG